MEKINLNLKNFAKEISDLQCKNLGKVSTVGPEVPPVSLSEFLPDSVGTRTLILRPGTRTTRYMSRAGRMGLSARANPSLSRLQVYHNV